MRHFWGHVFVCPCSIVFFPPFTEPYLTAPLSHPLLREDGVVVRGAFDGSNTRFSDFFF